MSGSAEPVHEFVPMGSFGRHVQLHALSVKAMCLAAELAGELDVPMPIETVGRHLAEEATAGGWDERDSWMVFALPDEAAGTKVRSDNGRGE
ncbi:hypothetical protein ABZ863_30330 [Saccharomonospora sp. NPDC046836]|uniref:hypothetical protein n=1 Tax=Saccharomonospora sp. NPDC046836 TaxID=3156921 RepID=UPI0033D0DB99